MFYKHFFVCKYCKRHVVSFTDEAMVFRPGRTHQEALGNGGEPMGALHPQDQDCIGELTYCSGYTEKGQRCPANHNKGTEEYQPPPRPANDPAWDDFEQRVSGAWTAFVNSNYSSALRGPNHDRQYRAPQGVLRRLQRANGPMAIGGLLYTIAPSQTTQVALHRPIPGAYQRGNILSFVFHL